MSLCHPKGGHLVNHIWSLIRALFWMGTSPFALRCFACRKVLSLGSVDLE